MNDSCWLYFFLWSEKFDNFSDLIPLLERTQCSQKRLHKISRNVVRYVYFRWWFALVLVCQYWDHVCWYLRWQFCLCFLSCKQVVLTLLEQIFNSLELFLTSWLIVVLNGWLCWLVVLYLMFAHINSPSNCRILENKRLSGGVPDIYRTLRPRVTAIGCVTLMRVCLSVFMIIQHDKQKFYSNLLDRRFSPKMVPFSIFALCSCETQITSPVA